jgi:adenosylcobinamide-phosphate synthase
VAIAALEPAAWLLASAVILDLLLGDPVYAAHPVRLMGRTLAWLEDRLRAAGLDGYGGGIALFFLLLILWVAGPSAFLAWLGHRAASVALGLHLFLVYSLLAMGDLLRHASAVEKAVRRNNLDEARQAVARLVGRDTDHMDLAACRRAAIESLSESLTDGFISPLFWYATGGVPGILLFKVVSTMDSMVGYKTPRYLQFGWCGARLDDLMNFLPARMAWLMIAAVAGLLPGYSLMQALTVGWRQHSVLPGPNSGWSEAATAGAIRRKLVGPIWANGKLVTQVWLGDAAHPPAETAEDFRKAMVLIVVTGLAAALVAVSCLAVFY